MVKVFCLVVTFFCISFKDVQNLVEVHPKPYDKNFGIGYSILQPNFEYGQKISSLADVDYKNFVLHTFGKNGAHWVCGQLHGGYWTAVQENGLSMDSLKWRGSRLLQSDAPRAEYILVWFDYWGASGSSDSDGYAQVWRLSEGKLAVVQQVRFNTHFDGDRTAFHFDAHEQTLKLLASHYLPGDSHCCISAFDELTFQWKGGLFRLVKRETKPTNSKSAS